MGQTEDDSGVTGEAASSGNPHGERPSNEFSDRDAEVRELAFTLEFAISAARAFVFEWNIAENKVHRRLGRAGSVLPPTAAEGDPLEAFLALVHPEDLPTIKEAIARSLEAPGQRYEVNYRVIQPDGKIAWLNEAGQAEAGPDGTAVRMIGISREITEAMETQLKLLESQHELQNRMSELEQLYARAPLGLGLLDPELRFVRINEAQFWRTLRRRPAALPTAAVPQNEQSGNNLVA